MKTSTKKQAGVVHLLSMALVVVIAVAGFAAYKVWQTNQHPDSGSQSSAAKTAANIPEAVNNASDLNQASTAVSSLPIDSDLNPTQMDADINQLQ